MDDPLNRGPKTLSAEAREPRVVVLTNAPVPYRSPMYAEVVRQHRMELHLVYCTGAYIDKTQDESRQPYAVHDLGGRYLALDKRFLHANAGIWRLLDGIRPDVLVTTGYVPTYLLAFAWARRHRVRHVAMTDGTLRQEASLTWLHRLLRRWVLRRSVACIGASRGSLQIFEAFGVPPSQCFVAGLCVDNDRFAHESDRTTDLLYSSRLVPHKNPVFALQVAERTARLLGRRVSLDVLGEGELLPALQRQAATLAAWVDVRFLGYRPQAELPQHYGRARLFLFPTSWEPWGLVANEACAAGLPVLIGEAAGSANELVIDGENGCVLPLDADQWASHCARLLTDEALWAHCSRRSRELVAGWSFQRAAAGFCAAIDQAMRGRA